MNWHNSKNDFLESFDVPRDFYKERDHGLMLKDSQIKILKRYQIEYQNYSDLASLLFEIEQCLNEVPNADDLEMVSEQLSEIYYYQETRK